MKWTLKYSLIELTLCIIVSFVMVSCIDNAKHGVGSSDNLTLLPDTANHVICYTIGAGSTGISCVHVDHPIVYQIETSTKK